MPTSLAQIRISSVDGGWLASCSCGHKTWHPRRPGADRAAHEHRASHAKAGPR